MEKVKVHFDMATIAEKLTTCVQLSNISAELDMILLQSLVIVKVHAGGNVVLLYAAKYHDVHKVVNISGRFDLEKGIEGRLGKNFLERIENSGFIDVTSKSGKFQYRVTKESLMDRLSTDIRAACHSIPENCRILTIHGSMDQIVPVKDALEFDKIIANHMLQIIDGADHEYTMHQNELVQVVLDFIRDQKLSNDMKHSLSNVRGLSSICPKL